jgi:hypothetical protein
VAEGWRILHNEELHNLYASSNITRVMKLRKMKWATHVARMGEMRNAYSILVGEHGWKKSLGIFRWMWEINIRRDLA